MLKGISNSTLVRILDKNHVAVGLGFFVSPELIVTCSHVIVLAGSSRDSAVLVQALGSGKRCSTTVVSSCWRDPELQDVGVLKITDKDFSSECTTVRLGSSDHSVSTELCVFGFPDAMRSSGLPGRAQLAGKVTEMGFETLTIQSDEITQGYSGSPVWDPLLDAVIGMVTEVIAPDNLGRLGRTALARPAEQIREILGLANDFPECPYRGLEPFEKEHAERYFGRQRAISELVGKLERYSLVGVTGTSGCGKSSLVRAGLEKSRALFPHSLIGKSDKYVVITSGFPVLSLLEVLSRDRIELLDRFFEDRQAFDQRDIRTASELSQRIMSQMTPHMVADYVRDTDSGRTTIIVIDQFERLYTECDDRVHRDFFTSLLLRLAERCIKVVISFRADCFGLVSNDQALFKAIESHEPIQLKQMNVSELREVIVEPAKVYGRFVQEELVTTLLGEITGQPGNLPLLSFALSEIWMREPTNAVLTMAAYKSLSFGVPDSGGLSGLEALLLARAEAEWSNLDSDGQQRAEQVLVSLVTVVGTEERRYAVRNRISRRAYLAEFDLESGKIISKLAKSFLLTLGEDPTTRQPTVELSHESLTYKWERLDKLMDRCEPWIVWYGNIFSSYLQQLSYSTEQLRFFLPLPVVEQAKAMYNQFPNFFVGAGRELYLRSELHYRTQKSRLRWLKSSIVSAAALLAIVVCLFLRHHYELTMAAKLVDAASFRMARKDFVSAEILLAESLQYQDSKEARERLVQARSSSLTLEWASPDPRPESCVVSVDGQICAGLDSSGRVTIWNTNTRSREAMLVPRARVERLCISNTMKGVRYVAVALTDHKIQFWAIRSDSIWYLNEVTGHHDMVSGMNFHPTEPLIATCSHDRSLRLWKAEQQGFKLEWENQHAHGTSVNGVCFSNSGGLVATAGGDYLVKVWSVKSGKVRSILSGHTDLVFSVAFGAYDRLLASAGYDHTIRIWDLTDTFSKDVRQRYQIQPKQSIRILTGHNGAICALRFSQDGSLLVSGSWDKTSRVWDWQRGTCLLTLPSTSGRVTSCAINLELSRLVSAGDSGWTVWAWGKRAGFQKYWNHGAGVTSVTTMPGSSAFAVGYADGTTIILNGPEPSSERGAITKFIADSVAINSVSIDSTGRWMATGNDSGQVTVWDLTSGELVARPVSHSQRVWCVAFIEGEEKLLVSGGEDGRLIFCDASRWRALDTVLNVRAGVADKEEQLAAIYSLQIGAKRKILAFGDGAGEIKLVSIGSKSIVGILPPRDSTDSGREEADFLVWGIGFLPDSNRLVSVTSDAALQLWEIDSLKQIEEQRATNNSTINSLAFSEPQHVIAICGDGGTVEIYDSGLNLRQRVLEDNVNLWAVAFDPGGRILAFGGSDGFARIYDLDSIDAVLTGSSKAQLLWESKTALGLAVNIDESPEIVGQIFALPDSVGHHED